MVRGQPSGKSEKRGPTDGVDPSKVKPLIPPSRSVIAYFDIGLTNISIDVSFLEYVFWMDVGMQGNVFLALNHFQ